MIITGDSLSVLKTLPDLSVNCIVTSPPYWGLRDYQVDGQLGLEPTYQEYIAKLIAIFNECYRVLKDDGTCFVNLGDTYGGSNSGQIEDNKAAKHGTGATSLKQCRPSATLTAKSLCQIPNRFAIAMTDNGWILRNEIIWHKPNVMPSSAKDRFTVDFEKVFFFTKKQNYYFEQQLEDYLSKPHKTTNPKYMSVQLMSAREKVDMYQNGQRNKRAVWTIPTSPYADAHFATFPEKLAETCIKSGCPKDGVVLDSFSGAATTGVVCKKLNREYIGIELNPEYVKLSENRIKNTAVNNSIMEFI